MLYKALSLPYLPDTIYDRRLYEDEQLWTHRPIPVAGNINFPGPVTAMLCSPLQGMAQSSEATLLPALMARAFSQSPKVFPMLSVEAPLTALAIATREVNHKQAE